MLYEILDASEKVINRIIADEKFVKTNYPDRFRAVTVDAETKEDAIASSIVIGAGKLLNCFTDDEYKKFKALVKTDAVAERFYDFLSLSKEVVLSDPYVVKTIDYLVSKNVCTEAIRSKVLTIMEP